MIRILLTSLALACGALQECGAMDLLAKPLPGEWTSGSLRLATATIDGALYGFAVHKDFKSAVRGK